MRAITNDSINAFLAGNTFSRGNMTVRVFENWVELLQHGNRIAWYDPREPMLNTLQLSNAGWWSVTTKERLDHLLFTVCQWHLCSVKGEWVMWTRKHGEEKPFNGNVTVRDLVTLDETIATEKDARPLRMQWDMTREEEAQFS